MNLNLIKRMLSICVNTTRINKMATEMTKKELQMYYNATKKSKKGLYTFIYIVFFCLGAILNAGLTWLVFKLFGVL